MVKVQRDRVFRVATVYAALSQFVRVDLAVALGALVLVVGYRPVIHPANGPGGHVRAFVPFSTGTRLAGPGHPYPAPGAHIYSW